MHAEHAIMAGHVSRNVGKRIRRIGDGDQHSLRSSTYDLGNGVTIVRAVLFQKPQPALGIAAVGGAAGFFVDARRDQDHAGTV